MQTETIFRIILPMLIIGFALHRGYYVNNRSAPEATTVKKREEGVASGVAGLLGLTGLVSMFAYVMNPKWLSWASLPLPAWLRWIGVGLAVLGFVLLQWAQNTLGKSWSDAPRMIQQQSLLTNGPYRTIRHPIYTAFILILGSTLFVSSNWLIGSCWAAMTILEVISRISFEESLMLEYFGDQYRAYMKETGRLVPRLVK